MGDDLRYFVQPDILSGVEPSWSTAVEEQFGPALPVIVYDDLDQTVDELYSGELGLAFAPIRSASQ